jgi:hypothetical protein
MEDHMSTRIIIALLLTVVLTGGAVSAQLFSAEVSPNPVLRGKPITIKIECTVAAELASGCGFDAVYQNVPSGTPIYQSLACPRIIRRVGPGVPFSPTWNCQVGTKSIPAGVYFVEIRWRKNGSSGNYQSHFVPFRVDANIPNTKPLLSTTTSTTRGKKLAIKVNSANQPGAKYVIAASFTTNKGFQLTPSLRCDLDLDNLFLLSLSAPAPLFQSFQGALDRFGIANASMSVPAIAALRGAQLSLQAVTVDTAGLQTTNALTRVIL